MKIKYQGGLTKLITSNLGNKNKKVFANFVNQNLYSLSQELNSSAIKLDIVSFSSSKDFYDQILSILSFLRHVGTPVSWTIYSDSSHTPDQIELLKKNFEFIKFELVDWKTLEYFLANCKSELTAFKNVLLDYAREHALGKRLFLYLNHDITKSTLFLDADVLFYHQASVLKEIITEEINGWYLPEVEWGCLDSRYKKNYPKQLYQVNGGFLIFNKNLVNVSKGLEFLKSLECEYEYFTEQTIVHMLLNLNGFMPLDPRKFILNSDDQFDISYLLPRDKMAIRHYTGPVRHKMWQKDWKWQLSLS